MQEALRKNKRRHVLIVTILCVILVAYGLMLLDTWPLTSKVKSIFKGEVPLNEIADKPVKIYNIFPSRPNTVHVEIDINTIFTVHNFQDGYIWVKFKCKAVDAEGQTTYGEVNTARWKIHKVNGSWEVLDIKQNDFGELFFI